MLVAQRLGFTLDPWQRELLAVALEVDDDGRLVYREVRLSVGRQNGKTLLALVVLVDRLLAGAVRGWGPRQRALYGSTNGRMAREKMLDVWVPTIERSSIAHHLGTVTKSNGTEAIAMGDAKVSVMPSSFTAGHGGTNDVVVVDEAFRYVDNRVEVGVRPTMITRPSPQVWIMSAAGEDEATSPWWHAKVTDSELRAASGTWGAVCALDYGAGGDDDRADPATWRKAIPALAAGRITEQAVADELDALAGDPAEFDRAYLNRWRPGAKVVIPAAAWARVRDPAARIAGPIDFAIDVSPDVTGDGRAAYIVAAGYGADGRPVVELVAGGPGTGWVVEEAKRLDRRHMPMSWTMDNIGPARAVARELATWIGERRFRLSSTAETCGATERLHEALLTAQVRFRCPPDELGPFDAAVAGAARRTVGDSWCWGRRTSAADVSPLVAASLAHFAAVARPVNPTLSIL